MASFTDQISNFNPYVQQLPVEAMVQVGMQKQAQYDAGVQKIQSYIDSVGGIEILNDVQRQHLQSKLNELGGKLKTVAAGDFSNQQLVNSVGGMATKLLKDPVIINAQLSTQKAKKELELAESLYKQGKSSIDNLNYLKDQIGKYASSTDINATFNDKYVNYVDFNKKWMDLADNLKKNAPEKSIDNPYKTDASGKTVYYLRDKSGKVIGQSTDPRSGGSPELSAAMKRTTIKGVSAQSMYDAIKADLTSDDLEQMKVNAWAHYRGKGPESFVRDLTLSTDQAKDMLKNEIHRLNVELTAGAKLTNDEKLEIQKNINKYQAKLDSGDLDKQLAENIEALKDPANLEKVKFDTYVKNTMNGKATTLSNQSFKEELLSNPYEEANHRRAVLQETIRHNNMTNTLGWANLKETKSQHAWEREWKLKEWDDKHPNPIVQDRAISSLMDAPLLGTVDKRINELIESKNTLNNQYGKTLGLNSRELDLLYSKYKADPSKITGNNALKYVTARDVAERDIIRQNNIKKTVEEGSKVFDQQLDAALANEKGVLKADGSLLFTAKQLYDAQKIVDNAKSFSGLGVPGAIYSGTGSMNVDYAKAMAQVGNDPAKKAIVTAILKKLRGAQLTPTEKVLQQKASEVNTRMGEVVENINKQKFNYQSKTIASLDPHYQEQVVSLDNKNEKDMSLVQQAINMAIQDYNDLGSLDLPAGTKFSPSDLKKLQESASKGGGSLRNTIIKRNDGSALLVLGSGEDAQTIPLNASRFASYFPKYAQSNRFNDDFHAIQANRYKTTNLSDGPGDRPQDAITAAHTGFEMPLLANTPWANKVRYDIIGDTNNDGNTESDRYALRLFIQNGNSWIPIESKGGFKNAATIQADIEQYIGPTTIEKLLKTHK